MQSRLAWALLAVALLAGCLLGVLTILWRRRQRMKDIQMRQQIVVMRMENTRNRITPHFIYNALTHEMLAQMNGHQVKLGPLTQLIRRGVDQAGELKTTLKEELTFVDYYVGIEAQQMGQDFQYVKEIAPDVDMEAVRLPAMTIQIFVENAIKHGLRRQGGLLTVRATRQGDATLVEVTDNGQGLSPQYHENTGLLVVRQTILMLNEQNQQQITFGVDNLEQGCRSWLILPDDYDYNL
jgi:LytS/YehU family sensor histidine kinase